MSTRKLSAGLFVLGGLLVVMASAFSLLADVDYSYLGKAVFETEAEYVAFKVAVGDTEVHINEMMVLSSEPPIVAEFWIEAPDSLDFQYGKRGILPSGDIFSSLLATGLAFLVGGILFRVAYFD